MNTEKTLSLRIPHELHKQIATLAERDLRSINAEIVFLLLVALNKCDYEHTVLGGEK